MAGEIKVNILTGFQDKGVKEAIDKLKGLGAGFKNIAKQLVGAYVGFQGFQKGVEFIRGSIDAARDLQRNLAGLNTIFASSTPEMKAFAEAGVQMGMSTAEAARATTFIGSVMKQSGFAMKDNIFYTKQLVSLGADLAATYGYDVQEALTGMTALFRGEYDPIEKFGVAIKQAQVNTMLAEQGMSKLTGTQKLHAQQLARMILLFKATSDVQGAFGRQTGTLAVAQQQLAATMTNLKATLGGQLIGPMTSLVVLMRSLTDVIGPPLQELFIAIGALIGGVGSNASEASNQIVLLINQLTTLVEFVTPPLRLLVDIMSSLGASIITAMLAFKVAKGIVTGFGTVVVALNTIMTANAVRAAAAAAATAALGVAESAAVAPTVALGAAMAATPWGAIALAVGLLAAGFGAVLVASANYKPQAKDLKDVMDGSASSFESGRGTMVALGAAARKSAEDMALLAESTTIAAKAAGTFGQKRDNTDIFKRGQVGTVKQSPVKKGLTEAEKALAAFKKEMQDMGLLGGDGLATGAGKVAKAIANPFKEMVKSIQADMAKVQDSIMSAFDITNMGTNGGSISRNIDKFMVKLREFSGYIKTLREKGLSGDLLQQLAMAGPEKGLAAAKAFAGDQNLINQANTAYGELGTTSAAIAGNVVQAKAAPVYNISVNAGVGDKKTIGKAVVEAIRSYEIANGNVWKKA
jgi:hypothetical protein